MPRADDPNVKFKEIKKPFKRKSTLKAWEVTVDDLKPTINPTETTQAFSTTNPIENKESASANFTENNLNTGKPDSSVPVKTMEYATKQKQENLINKLPIINQNVVDSVKRLYGLQKKLLYFIVENCVARNELQTDFLSKEVLKKVLDTDSDNVKTVIHRLQTKGLISRENGKKGPGGFRIFNITEEVRDAVVADLERSKLANN